MFLEMYNNVCTRCFGWTLPNTMMVPLADCQNHLPVDTHYDVYSKDLHISKQSVNSARTQKFNGNLRVDFSQLYTKKFIEELDPEYQAIIKGQTSKKKKKKFVRSANIEKIRHKMELNMKYMLFGMKDKIDKPDIWQ